MQRRATEAWRDVGCQQAARLQMPRVWRRLY